MNLVDILIKSLTEGDSPNNWLLMKFISAGAGGLSAFMFKHYSSGESKINFWWKGFWFVLVSTFGGVFIIGPETAFNAFVAGLLGWSAIANTLKQENQGASDESYKDKVLAIDELKQLFKRQENE